MLQPWLDSALIFSEGNTAHDILHTPIQPTDQSCSFSDEKPSLCPAFYLSFPPHPTQLRTVWFPEPRWAATNCGGEFSLTICISPPCNYKSFLSDRLKALRHPLHFRTKKEHRNIQTSLQVRELRPKEKEYHKQRSWYWGTGSPNSLPGFD